ncbi:hypothetical protein MHYP_G00345960 [Metynnis hypsauchen]
MEEPLKNNLSPADDNSPSAFVQLDPVEPPQAPPPSSPSPPLPSSSSSRCALTVHAVSTRRFCALIGCSRRKQAPSANGSAVHALSHAVHAASTCTAERKHGY